MYKNFSLIIVTCLLLTGCDMKSSHELGYGEIVNGTYTNAYFDMSIEVPANWTIQSQAAQAQLMDLGTNLISGDDDNLKNVLKEAQKQVVSLFTFFKYEPGTPVSFNPSIISVAERISHMPGIKRGSDYLFHIKKIFESGQLKYEFPGDIYTKDISGILFDVMPLEINVGNVTVRQEYYVAKINDYVLSFILSYSSDLEINELNEIFGKLHFSNSMPR